jgi:type II secretory pathway component PulF
MQSGRSSTQPVWPGLVFFFLWMTGVVAALAGVPHWLQMAGWLLLTTYLVGGSLYLIFRSDQKGRQSFGEICLLSPRIRRWVLDEPEPPTKR